MGKKKMIVLRELKEEDAPLMLEWMHDPDIKKGLRKDLSNATIEDAKGFINAARFSEPVSTGQSRHFAIADSENDRYLGTVSLKNIDMENGTAEYAIIVRSAAQGQGVACEATDSVLKKAFYEIGLNRVFLSVYSDNYPAIRVYEKSGFKYEGEFRDHFLINGKRVGWKWYGILKEEFAGKGEQC